MDYKSLVKKLLEPNLRAHDRAVILSRLQMMNLDNFVEKTIESETDNLVTDFFTKKNEEETKNNNLLNKLQKISCLQNQISKTNKK